MLRRLWFESLKTDADNAFFSRSLEYVKARVYGNKPRELLARRFIPKDTEVDPDAETVRIRSYNQVGVAKLLASYAQDLPRSDIKAEEMVRSIRGIGNAYGYALDEVRAAARANINLDEKKGAAARRAVEALIDRILAVGDDETGLLGLLNQPNASVYTIPNGDSLATAWTTKTPKEILQDLVGICEYVSLVTNEVEQVNLIVLPRPQYVAIATTQFSIASETSILDYFKKAYPGVNVERWYRLTGAGTAVTDRMLAYVLSPDHLTALIPREFEQLPVQEKGLEFEIPCHARCGGVVAYYPLSICYGDGI